MDTEPWYSARCIFRHEASASRGSAYEERVILLRAKDLGHALRKAEDEARGYAASLEGVEYVEFLDVYHLFEDLVGDGTEVFSLIRESGLERAEYITRFFDTGSERSEGPTPRDEGSRALD